MSESFEERRRARLLELLARSDDPSRALEGSDLAEDPEAEKKMRELLDLERKLAAAGRAARAELADAEQLDSGPSRSEVVPPLPGIRSAAQTAGSRRRALVLLLPGIAAAAALLLWFFLPSRDGGETPVYLGDEAVLQPRGASASFAFRWDVDVPAGGYFVVRVSELDPGPDGRTLVHESAPIRGQEWTPDPDTVREWPRRIHWELLVYDGSSPRPTSSHSADAWLE